MCSFSGARCAPGSSKQESFANKPFSIATLLYLATAGGAAVCGLEKQVGSFAAGKSFDGLLVSVRDEVGNVGIWGLTDNLPHGITVKERSNLLDGWLERFFFCGDDRNIEKVFVQGRFIGGRTFKS